MGLLWSLAVQISEHNHQRRSNMVTRTDCRLHTCTCNPILLAAKMTLFGGFVLLQLATVSVSRCVKVYPELVS